MGGHASSGGIGILSRSFGLTSDQLLEVKLITADGKMTIANNKTNTDLFWALQGGGAGSFGIATEFVLQTHSVTNLGIVRISGRHFVHEVAQWISAWQEVVVNSPNQLGFQLYCANTNGTYIENFGTYYK